MFLKFSQQRELIFLDSHSSEFNVVEKVDVILSPELYWVRKVSIPVKSVRQARTLVESLFEGILPSGEFSYSIYKKDDAFYIFAYDDKVILELLDSKGLPASQIHNVYFAQSEFSSTDEAIEVNTSQSMYFKDDILILVPSLWLENKKKLSLENFALSKNHIVLKQYKHIINDKYIYTIGSILVFLIMITGVEYFIINSKVSEMESKREMLFETSKLKPTMMQSRAMLSEYKSLHEQQKKLREYIGKLLSIHLVKGEKLAFLSFKKNKINISFSGISTKRQRNIENTLKQKNIQYKSHVTKSLVKMEIIL